MGRVSGSLAILVIRSASCIGGMARRVIVHNRELCQERFKRGELIREHDGGRGLIGCSGMRAGRLIKQNSLKHVERYTAVNCINHFPKPRRHTAVQ